MIQDELFARLVADFGFERRETADGVKLVRGRCPACNAPEAYTPPGNPYVVICPRRNKCRTTTHTKGLYPELFNQFARHHPNSKADPRATQRAYLASRGIDGAAIAEWWEPDATTDPDEVRAHKADPSLPAPRKYPTVRFALTNGVAYHRLIDYGGKTKNKIVAAYAGHYWRRPGTHWDRGIERMGEVWLTEGVLDAVSLVQVGLAAVATISSGHVPVQLLDSADARTTYVIALDNDPAGRAGADKLAQACAERGLRYKLAFPPEGVDWNDLLVRGELAPGRREKTLELADWRGRLHAANSAAEYYDEWKQHERGPLFAWRGELYAVRPGKDGGEPDVHRVSDFTAERLYRLRLEPIAERPDYSEVIRVHREDDEPHEVVLGASALAKNPAFREALFSQASAQWDGITPDLNALLRNLRETAVPTVRQVEVWGYDRRADSYFFPDAAFGPDGKRMAPDERGIVEIAAPADGAHPARKQHFRLPRLGEDEVFTWVAPAGEFGALGVARLLAAAEPHGHGLAGLGFFAAALFAHQVCERLGMFPFLSLFGETMTGKSTLLRILHHLLGREWEGMPVNEANTKVGQSRYIGGYSNLPVALIEADAHENVKLEAVMNLRTAYNRGAIRVTGIKSADNTVRATPFRGALVFGWNDEQLEDAKVRERMISLRFARADNSQEKHQALVDLENIPVAEMGRFRDLVLGQRDKVLARILEMLPAYQEAFEKRGVEMTRTAQNHAVPMAGLHAALATLLPESTIDERTRLGQLAFNGLAESALRKERELRQDPDDLQLFFERIGDWIRVPADGGIPRLANYTRREGEIAISLKEVEDKFASDHLQFNRIAILKALRASKHLLRANSSERRPDGSKVKCWVFRREAID
jgi:hypothetical protein